jgi:hypothetical protein
MPIDIFDFIRTNSIANKNITIDLEESVFDEPISFSIELGLLWVMYESTYLLQGTARVLILATIGATISRVLERSQADHRVHTAVMYSILRQIIMAFPTLDEDASPEECVLAFTYTLLKQKKITHTEAAAFASSVLNTSFEPDAWRMRLTRWIEKRGLEKIGQRRRQPVTNGKA